MWRLHVEEASVTGLV